MLFHTYYVCSKVCWHDLHKPINDVRLLSMVLEIKQIISYVARHNTGCIDVATSGGSLMWPDPITHRGVITCSISTGAYSYSYCKQ